MDGRREGERETRREGKDRRREEARGEEREEEREGGMLRKECYADYLRVVYAMSPMAIDRDKWPPTPSTTYIRLALIKKEKVSRGEADHFTRLTLQGEIDTILKAKHLITVEDVLEDNDTHLDLHK